MTFTTPITLSGPLRSPVQMLEDQEYGGHNSIHDDAKAQELGFRAGPIEGPTHFSLYPPLMQKVYGQAWFERGCISAHYQNMVVEGEKTRAFVEWPQKPQGPTRAWVEKEDGTAVQEASANLGGETTLLESRLKSLRPAGKLVVLEDLEVGMTGAQDEVVRMDPDQHLGNLYPFSLNQKLKVITESSPWYSDPSSSPWGRAIVPLEMVSVLGEYSNRQAGWPVKGPAVGLFADQEIRMIDGPLFVGEEYVLRREIVALSESKRTEGYWIRTRFFDSTGRRQVAEMLLNHAIVKASYENYDELRAAREG
ncbi:MAG: hypothetical protein ACK5MR_05715 [Cumulibacter sp.]